MKAYAAVRDAFGFRAMYDAVDALDNKLPGARQLEIYEDIGESLRLAIGQFIKNGDGQLALDKAIDNLNEAASALEPALLQIMPAYLAGWVRERTEQFEEDGLPGPLARKIALMPILAMTPDIMSISRTATRDTVDAAKAFYAVTKLFKMGAARTPRAQPFRARLLRRTGAEPCPRHDELGAPCDHQCRTGVSGGGPVAGRGRFELA